MKALLAGLLFVFALPHDGVAESSASFSSSAVPSRQSPDLPPAPYRIRLVDGALYTSILAYRTMDFFSSQPCLHSLYCTEGALPDYVVSTKPGFAAFEAAMAFSEISSSVWMHRHHRAALARAMDLFSVSAGTLTVLHNYAIPKYH